MDFAGWSIEPPIAYVVVAGLLYWLGGRRLRSRQQPLRTASFWAGMATIVLAGWLKPKTHAIPHCGIQ